ncbi:MAG TPA: hypothetical protein VFZ53_22385 [Polyangiaceae bacterium]
MSFGARPVVSSLARLAWALALFSAGTACRSKNPAPPAPSARPPASSPAAPQAARCRSLSGGAGLVVGTASGPPKVADEDGELELPFATATGSAVAVSGGFAVGGIGARERRSEAFVAFVPADGKPGTSVSLTAVHGDPDPPLVAPDGAGALVAVETSDAGGRALELFRVFPNGEKPLRGAEVTGVGEGGATLAAAETSSVLVWTTGKAERSTLRAAGVTPGAPQTLAAIDLPGTEDAESPVLRARPGGFWLAWIAEKPALDAGARESADAGEETRPLDSAPRVLFVAPLGAEGRPSGAPRAVSGAESHVVAFDAATLADGALGLAWREDDAAPGVESGGTELGRVAPDGAVSRGRAADETLSAGAPSLVREEGPPHRVWLLAPGEDDRLRMALVAPNGTSTSPFVADESLRGAEILAALPGKACGKEPCQTLLLARAKQRAVELSVAECRP